MAKRKPIALRVSTGNKLTSSAAEPAITQRPAGDLATLAALAQKHAQELMDADKQGERAS